MSSDRGKKINHQFKQQSSMKSTFFIPVNNNHLNDNNNHPRQHHYQRQQPSTSNPWSTSTSKSQFYSPSNQLGAYPAVIQTNNSSAIQSHHNLNAHNGFQSNLKAMSQSNGVVGVGVVDASRAKSMEQDSSFVQNLLKPGLKCIGVILVASEL